MIVVVSGMNALVRRSCVRVTVRTFAAAVKPEGPGSGNKKSKGNTNKKAGNKSKPVSPPSASTRAPAPTRAPSPAPAPPPTHTSPPNAEPTPSIASFHESLNASERPHIPLPTPNPPLSSYALGPEKLRALIDLYHSSTGYITPETLSSAIDKTFAPARRTFNSGGLLKSYRDLVAERDELDAEPDRVVPSANELSGRGHGTVDGIAGPLAGGWSESKAERARMVKAALWGVDPMAKIGLETLLEAKVELEAQDKERKE
ncbi:unnamed protein product [Rhizoctonia solani]|uniref:Uncharacterized protein n=1 Tax=Rhizoctonia solani TaxID=456999 RepID=A0A8H2XHM6_9AGAM|nr:unnamed protein product [Rhizoctonia solani]